MKSYLIVSLTVLLTLSPLLSIFSGIAIPNQRAEEKNILIDSFYGGDREKLLNLSSNYFSTDAKIEIPNNSTVNNATLSLTAKPTYNGRYPEWVKMDIGDDGKMDWMFRSRGYGSFGNQTVFTDDASQKLVQLSQSGSSSSTSFYLPKNATIKDASLSVTGKRNIITKTKIWQTSSWGSYYPFSGRYYSGIRFQTLLPKSTIGHAGYIDKVYFNVVSYPSTTPRFNNFKVYLANTSKSSLSGTFSNNYDDDEVLVYSASTFTPTNQNGWMPIDIKDIFYFNNTKNLLLEIRWSGDNGLDVTVGYQYYYSQYYSVWSYSSSASSGSVQRYRFNFRLDFLGDFPHNATVDVGNDNSPELSISGKFAEKRVLDIKNTVIQILQNTPPTKSDGYGNDFVEFSINVTTDTQGAFLINNLKVHYNYVVKINKLDDTDLLNLLRSKVQKWPNEGSTIIPINVSVGGNGDIWLGDLKIGVHLPNYSPMFMTIPSNYSIFEDSKVDKLINLSKYVYDDLDNPENMLYLVKQNSEDRNVNVYITDNYYLGVDATVKENWNGKLNVRLSVTDSGGKYCFSNVFQITVIPVNDEPIATGKVFDQIFFDEDGPTQSIYLDQHGSGYFFDVEGDHLYYYLESITPDAGDYLSWKVSTIANNTTKISFTPLKDANTDGRGPIKFRIYADDDLAFNLSANPHKDLEIFIEGVPDPPRWGNIPLLKINEDSGKNLWFNIKDVLTDVDTPFKDLDISIISISTEMVNVVIENSTEVYVTPQKNFFGNGSAVFRAEDEENTVETTGFFQILPVNDPPMVTITSPENGTEVSSSITIAGTADDVDSSVSFVEVRIDDKDWMRASGTIIWSYSIDVSTLTAGGHTISARSFDGESFSKIAKITIIVKGVTSGGGNPPTVNIETLRDGDEVYGTIILRGRAYDDNGVRSVEIKIDDGPWRDASINDTNWDFKWVTTNVLGSLNDSLPITITVRAFDGKLYSSEVTVTVFVNNYDSDHDGLPNVWEENNGLDPYDPSDSQGDKDGDGYTNEEEYKYHTDPQDSTSYPFKAKAKNTPWLLIIIIIVVITAAVLLAGLTYSKKTGEVKEKKRVKKEKPPKEKLIPEVQTGKTEPKKITPPVKAKPLTPPPASPLKAQPLKPPIPTTQMKLPNLPTAPTPPPLQIPQIPQPPPAPSKPIQKPVEKNT